MGSLAIDLSTPAVDARGAPCVLVLSADAALCDDAERELSARGFVPLPAADLHDARRYLGAARAVDVTLVDLRGAEGGAFAQWALAAAERTAVVLVADPATLPDALLGLRHGARDVVEAPLSWALVSARLARALRPAPEEAGAARRAPAVLASSTRLGAAAAQVRRAARADVPVLLLGPPGVPRASLAALLHDESGRAHRSFQALSCIGAPTEALERRIFGGGAERGALVSAAGGTLLLDGIEHLPEPLQKRLVRCLEARQVDRPGGRAIALDVRLVAAAEERISEAAAGGTFRADLFYRLAGFTVHVPPLRERLRELPAVTAAVLEELAARAGRAAPSLSSEALAALAAYGWPGDDEELVCTLSRALVLSGDGVIRSEHLPRDVVEPREPPRPAAIAQLLSFEEYESQALQAALDEEGGNVTHAARRLGIGRATFYRKARKFGVRLR